MRIGVDIDDVLFPWFQKAHTACTKAGITNGRTPSRWECHEDYGVPLQVWVDVLQQATLDGTLYHGEPFPDAVPALSEAKKHGHTVHLVTARGFFDNGDIVRLLTIEWLRDNNIPHDTLTFAKDKTLVNLDVAVDDSLRNVQALRSAGVTTALMDAPHNRDVDDPSRVSTLTEFVDHYVLGRR